MSYRRVRVKRPAWDECDIGESIAPSDTLTFTEQCVVNGDTLLTGMFTPLEVGTLIESRNRRQGTVHQLTTGSDKGRRIDIIAIRWKDTPQPVYYIHRKVDWLL